MTIKIRFLPVVVCVVIVFSIQSFAQTPDRRQTNSTPRTQEQLSNLQSNTGSIDVVAKELGLLRKQLETLNNRLREISEKIPAPDSSQSGSPNDKQKSIQLNLGLLSSAEQRAEILRKQLLELIEKEMLAKSRLVQLEEDIRPDSIDRTMSLTGSTRTPEQRDTRRRVLENERRGLESLFNQIAQSRQRLEETVKQADSLVIRLRQRILPLIERELEKINPN